MKRVIRETIALPVNPQVDTEAEALPPVRSRSGHYGPAIGVAVAFTASIVLWSLVANIVRLAYHSVF